MKNFKNSPASTNTRFGIRHAASRRARTTHSHSHVSERLRAGEIAADILFHETETLNALNGIVRHPRSLARPTPTWRPPLKELPAVAGFPALTMAITRHRVGERARARVLGYGEDRVPAYLVSVRITDSTGASVTPELAEAWVRAMVPPELADAVHEPTNAEAQRFVWLVDSAYLPVHSPVSLFAGFSLAA